jgi:hypothetical protein
VTSTQWVSPFEDQNDLDLDIMVYRAVNPGLVDWNDTDADGTPKMGSQIFQHMSDDRATAAGYSASAMSVALSHLLDKHLEGPERVLDEFGYDWGIAMFTVSDVRAVEPALGICEDPIDGAPWHGLVYAMTRSRMKKAESGALRSHATLIRLPKRPQSLSAASHSK